MDLSPTFKSALAQLAEQPMAKAPQNHHAALLLWLSTSRALSQNTWLDAALAQAMQSVVIDPEAPASASAPSPTPNTTQSSKPMESTLQIQQLYQLLNTLQPADLVQAMLTNEFGTRFTTSKTGQWLIRNIGQHLSQPAS